MDLSTAFAVKEREDGLLEKLSFDLSTAVPKSEAIVEPNIPKEVSQPNWILSTIKESIAPYFTNPKEKIYTGRKSLVKEADILPQDKPYAQPAPNRPGWFEVGEQQERWEVATEIAVNLVVIGYGVKQLFGFVKNELGIRKLARDIGTKSQQYANEFIKINGKAAGNIQTEEANKILKGREALVNFYQKKAMEKLSAIELEGGKVQTVAKGQVKKFNFAKLLGEELKAFNVQLGEAGQALVKRPKIGDIVSFEKGGELLTGAIKSITGNVAEINLGKGAEAVVATLSQLSLPEAPKPAEAEKMPVEVVSGEMEGIVEPPAPTGEGQKPPVEPLQVITKADLPPEEPPKFPGVSEEFLKQPKKKTTILQYFTPAEYHLKELGFEAKIGQPVRESLQKFSIELMKKNELLVNLQKEHQAQIARKDIKTSNEKVWQYMDKGIPEGDTSVEANIARKMRPETEEMLRRINEVNKEIGREEVKGVKNYILHMLKPELLNEIYAKGVIPPELAKVMEYIPTKNVFLRTAMQRKGIPDEWLTKDPYELMRAMYAIDLRYVYLQKSLNDIQPYLKAVKEYVGEEGDYWSPETYKYLDDWVKQAIKMRPSNWDTLIDNMLEYTIAPLLRKRGLKVSHMPWRDFVSTMSAAAHTGALGMRVRPILRNLVQSTFDWVMYGTKPYLKASVKFMTPEGHEILKQTDTWRTRVPFEAQDLSTMRKIFKVGSLGYRWSDLHNVGKGLLTRYYHAVDDLGKTHEQALKWADSDLPATQWSYRREDLPRAYWTTTGRAFWTLGSWWMNFYTRFLPELTKRAFIGKDVMGRVVPVSERLGIMRLLILAGTLFAIKEKSKEILGTTIDYTGQIKPTPLREAPIAQLGKSLVKISQGFTDGDERTRKTGMKELANTAKIFIPWELAAEDLWKLLNGEKDLGSFLFYQKKEKKTKKVR